MTLGHLQRNHQTSTAERSKAGKINRSKQKLNRLAFMHLPFNSANYSIQKGRDGRYTYTQYNIYLYIVCVLRCRRDGSFRLSAGINLLVKQELTIKYILKHSLCARPKKAGQNKWPLNAVRLCHSYTHRVVRISVTFKVKGLTIVISLDIKVHYTLTLLLLRSFARCECVIYCSHIHTFMGMVYLGLKIYMYYSYLIYNIWWF